MVTIFTSLLLHWIYEKTVIHLLLPVQSIGNSNTHIKRLFTFSNIFFHRNDSSSDFRYEGTRKQSLGNIYNQQKPSQSGSSGALDNLMADLMNSMNDDIHLMSPPVPTHTKSNNCAVCQEEFDYRDDVKTVGRDVWSIFIKRKSLY